MAVRLRSGGYGARRECSGRRESSHAASLPGTRPPGRRLTGIPGAVRRPRAHRERRTASFPEVCGCVQTDVRPLLSRSRTGQGRRPGRGVSTRVSCSSGSYFVITAASTITYARFALGFFVPVGRICRVCACDVEMVRENTTRRYPARDAYRSSVTTRVPSSQTSAFPLFGPTAAINAMPRPLTIVVALGPLVLAYRALPL